jgi:hypothetical protein
MAVGGSISTSGLGQVHADSKDSIESKPVMSIDFMYFHSTTGACAKRRTLPGELEKTAFHTNVRGYAPIIGYSSQVSNILGVGVNAFLQPSGISPGGQSLNLPIQNRKNEYF